MHVTVSLRVAEIPQQYPKSNNPWLSQQLLILHSPPLSLSGVAKSSRIELDLKNSGVNWWLLLEFFFLWDLFRNFYGLINPYLVRQSQQRINRNICITFPISAHFGSRVYIFSLLFSWSKLSLYCWNQLYLSTCHFRVSSIYQFFLLSQPRKEKRIIC